MLAASVRGQGVEYAIRDIMSEAERVRRSGKKLIQLNIGDPVKYGFKTPVHIRDALTKAVDSGLNYYSASEGLKELREAIAEKENAVNGAQIEPDDVIVTAGISEAIMFVMGAILDPGDEALMPGPCYPPYLTYAKFFDGNAVTYRTVEEESWLPDLADLENKISKKTKLIVIINPNNPCGSVYSKEEISQILALAASNDIPVAADEIYDRIVYDGNFTSVASIARDVPLIGLNGFSKAYLMTGWRLGYVFIQDPEGKLDKVWDTIQRMSRVRLCTATPIQFAGVEALRGPQEHIRKMVSTLKRRRDFSWKRVNEIPGLSASKPAGAFYLFPKLQLGSKWNDDKEFVTDLLKETGVIVVNGSGFDPDYGKEHFRAVFLPPEEMLNEGFNAIEEFMKRHG
jgi:alanine-synthesizing transaminase